MPTPFLALAPFVPRVVDVPYFANTLPCSDVTDQTDQTDGPTDVSDSEIDEI